MMKISFYGAAREVTGSCTLIEASGKNFLIDCGMQQGQDEKEGQALPFDASAIDLVLLTHAHIDHSGRLPLLVKQGFRGKIYAIEATLDLLSIMLEDSAKIQESDAFRENRKRRRAGKEEIEPLYTMEDAEKTLGHIQPLSYDVMTDISKDVAVRFVDAGHILGSASIEIFIKEGSISKKLVFSGDIGNLDQPIIKDPQYIFSADYIVMEATYGDRSHIKHVDFTEQLAGIIDKTLSRGGNVIIPSFAIGRTQGLLYLIREIKERGLVSIPGFPVYVDSPMASEATRLYDDDLHIYGDSETRDIVANGTNPLDFPNLEFTDSVEDSKSLNYDPVPKVIISSSGMCEGGRIGHHLKHNLWKQEASVVFVGFQAKGTLGRTILEGADKVTIYGEEVKAAADIHNFTGLSAHADKEGLIDWVNRFKEKPERIFVIHAEEEVSEVFLDTLHSLGFDAVAPKYRQSYDLSDGALISGGD
jgi:metallo-beta-lactamase family protein